MTIPNMLSIFRLIMVPVYAVCYLTGDSETNILAGVLLIVSTLTDGLDGWIARRFNQTSELGKILDPLADKLTQFCVTVCLVTRHRVLLPLVIYIFTKEMLMLLFSLPMLVKKSSVPPSRWYGKVATFVLFFFVVCFTMFPDFFRPAMGIIGAVLIALLTVALFGYGRQFIQMQYDSDLRRLTQSPETVECGG